MNKKDENYYSMVLAVYDLLQREAAIFGSIRLYIVYMELMSGLIAGIQEQNSIFDTDTSGKTVEKNKTRILITDLILSITSALYLIADNENNEELKAATDVNKSTIDSLRDTDMAGKAEKVHELAFAHAEALAENGS